MNHLAVKMYNTECARQKFHSKSKIFLLPHTQSSGLVIVVQGHFRTLDLP